MVALAILGGTGIEQLSGMECSGERVLETPYGAMSAPVREGAIGGQPVLFLQRHGSPRAIAPHRINYRANIWGLHHLGARRIVGINAVGGISPDMRPGRLLIPDQLIDYTWGREHTFDARGAEPLHIDFTEPYDPALRRALLDAAAAAEIAHAPSGVLAVTQGPRLETAAEVQRLARDGCDVVGMTGMPEAALARELDLAYATICMVVNAAAGLDDKPLTLAAMRDALEQEAQSVARVLHHLGEALAVAGDTRPAVP